MNLEERMRKAKEDYYPGDEKGITHKEYSVFATFSDGMEEEVGSLTLPIIKSYQDMPIELEIDGVIYKPEF